MLAKIILYKNSLSVVFFLLFGFYFVFLNTNLAWTTEPPDPLGRTKKDLVNHNLSHFLDDEKTNKDDVLRILGEPNRRVKKLAGWEYWYYDQYIFDGIAFTPASIKYLTFKDERFVSPSQYARRQHPNLKIIFFPVTLCLFLPFSVFSVTILFLMSLYGAIKLKDKARYVSVYIGTGCLLCYLGVIFL